MKTLLTVFTVAAIALVVLGGTAATSHGQCILICPLGDGGVSPGNGTKTVDLDGDGIVALVDLATFALSFPPNPYNFCVDFDCNGIIGLVDLAIFAIHWGHAGPVIGVCQAGIDHYKPYDIINGPVIPGPVTLTDQFGTTNHDILAMTRIATPVDKNGEGILDPRAHQTWWEFLFPEPQRLVTAQDQFGEGEWFLGDSRFLIAPAIKNPQPGDILPDLNHYKCYDAQGPFIGIPVQLGDQFEDINVFVLEGVLFCNPVEKIAPGGELFPIVDPTAHLTCYLVDNLQQYGFEVFMWDQFIQAPVLIDRNDLLCLPAVKTQVIQPLSSEWYRIKALFEGMER